MKKAIVIDDTKNIRNLLTTALELYGYEVLTAANGQEALDALSKNAFDIIFLDIKMPEISGTEVLRRIRAMGIFTPVIIMTAFATVKNAVECTKLDVVAYLQKPFTAEKIKSVIQSLNLPTDGIKDEEELISDCNELIHSGKIDEAYNRVKKLLAKNPCCWSSYSLLAQIFTAKGDYHKANKFTAAYNLFIENES